MTTLELQSQALERARSCRGNVGSLTGRERLKGK